LPSSSWSEGECYQSRSYSQRIREKKPYSLRSNLPDICISPELVVPSKLSTCGKGLVYRPERGQEAIWVESDTVTEQSEKETNVFFHSTPIYMCKGCYIARSKADQLVVIGITRLWLLRLLLENQLTTSNCLIPRKLQIHILHVGTNDDCVHREYWDTGYAFVESISPVVSRNSKSDRKTAQHSQN
jgi:hypothetical protein